MIILSHRSSVRVGDYDTRTDPDCGSTGFCAPVAINHAVSQIIVHPDYIEGQYHHDIALLILRTPINYTGKYTGFVPRFVFVCFEFGRLKTWGGHVAPTVALPGFEGHSHVG